MRTRVIVSLALMMVLLSAATCLGVPVGLTSFTFTPQLDADLEDLDHFYYYAWEIDGWTVPAGQTIVGAQLRITNIWDWQQEPDDVLYYHLLDAPPVYYANPASDYRRWWDNQAWGDNWAARERIQNQPGYKLGEWTDPAGGAPTGYDLVYTFNAFDLAMLTQYALNGNFGFGFDPDCHYNNDGISFVIYTSAVPEPGTLILLGSGLVGLAALRRRGRG